MDDKTTRWPLLERILAKIALFRQKRLKLMKYAEKQLNSSILPGTI